MDLLTPAEQAIRSAVDAVERLGAHAWLTDAVTLLGQAREKVADYLELEPGTPASAARPPEAWYCVEHGDVRGAVACCQRAEPTPTRRHATPTPPTAPPRERESEKKGCAWCSAGYVKTPDGVRHAGCCPTCGGGGMLFFPCLAPAAPAASLPPSAEAREPERRTLHLCRQCARVGAYSAEHREPGGWFGKTACSECGAWRDCRSFRSHYTSAPPAGSGETEPVRYDMDFDDNGFLCMKACRDGDWVRYEDYARLAAHPAAPPSAGSGATELDRLTAYIAGCLEGIGSTSEQPGYAEDVAWATEKASAWLAAHPAGTTREEG